MMGYCPDLFYTDRSGQSDCKAVRVMRTRVIQAGDTLEIEQYPVLKLNRQQQRAARRARTRELQHRINRRRRTRKVCRLIEKNFTHADFCVHGTWERGSVDPGFANLKDEAARLERLGVPWEYGEALRDVQNFVRRIRARQQRRDRAEAIKYLYVIEEGKATAGGLPPSYHFHMVLHAPTVTRDELEDLWRSGKGRGYCNVDRLDLNRDGALSLARYITKQNARINTSKKLEQPTITVTDRKLSTDRAGRLTREIMRDGKGFFERRYGDYVCTQPQGPEVWYSDFLPGAYIFARLRRKSAERGKQGALMGRNRTAL